MKDEVSINNITVSSEVVLSKLADLKVSLNGKINKLRVEQQQRLKAVDDKYAEAVKNEKEAIRVEIVHRIKEAREQTNKVIKKWKTALKLASKLEEESSDPAS